MSKQKNKKTWLWEFSKRIVMAVAVIYVIAIIYSEVFMFFFPDSVAINGFITDVFHPFSLFLRKYKFKSNNKCFS